MNTRSYVQWRGQVRQSSNSRDTRRARGVGGQGTVSLQATGTPRDRHTQRRQRTTAKGAPQQLTHPARAEHTESTQHVSLYLVTRTERRRGHTRGARTPTPAASPAASGAMAQGNGAARHTHGAPRAGRTDRLTHARTTAGPQPEATNKEEKETCGTATRGAQQVQ